LGRVEARRVGVEEQHRRIFGDGEEAVAECPKQVGSSQTGAIAGAYSHHHDRKEQPRESLMASRIVRIATDR